jgi:hypothetical protein
MSFVVIELTGHIAGADLFALSSHPHFFERRQCIFQSRGGNSNDQRCRCITAGIVPYLQLVNLTVIQIHKFLDLLGSSTNIVNNQLQFGIADQLFVGSGGSGGSDDLRINRNFVSILSPCCSATKPPV